MMVKSLMRALIVLLVLCASGLLALVYWPKTPGSGVAVSGSRTDLSPQSAVLGQFTPLDPPLPAPEVGFAGRDGASLHLADFRGRWVLVNLWATWCVPCVREMPALDRLQAKLGNRLTVLAISEDRGAAPVVEPFLEKLGLATLAIYLDPKGGAQRSLGVQGLPTSFLIDGEGRILGKLEGAAAWDSPEMVAKLERYLAQTGS